MNIENLRDYCLSLPFSEEKFPFDDETLVFCVGGKIFALVDLGNATRVNLKCEPEQAIMLREAYEGIIPGWHMNKKHWNTVFFDTDVPINCYWNWCLIRTIWCLSDCRNASKRH